MSYEIDDACPRCFWIDCRCKPKVVPFERPAVDVTKEGDTTERRLWQPPPTVSPFGGSLEGASTEEVQEAAIKQNPMRVLKRLRCYACQNQWQAPAKGNCPACGSDKVDLISTSACMAQRV